MILPEFPLFKEVDLSVKDAVTAHLARYPLEASEYTFTNILAFRSTYNFKISLLSDNLILLKDTDPVSAFCPVGNYQIPDALDAIFDYLKVHTDMPYMERVPESFVNACLKDNDNFIVEEQRDHFDYVHEVRELIELRGRKYHDKKNKVNKFRSLHTYEYLTLTPDLIEECLAFEDYWCEVKECEKYYGLEKERCAIFAMLNNFGALNIKGGAIRIDNKIAALSLGEKLIPGTIVIHVEKANPDFPGLYQVINQEFLMHEADEYRFVNREQDLGIQGLRNAKMSYNPVRFVKKYKVRRRIN